MSVMGMLRQLTGAGPVTGAACERLRGLERGRCSRAFRRV